MSLEDEIYSAAPPWVRTVLMNLHAMRIRAHRYGAPFRARVRELKAFESASRESVEAYQSERLRAIVAFAYSKSSYYRRLLDESSVRPQDITGVEALELLPLLTRELLRAHELEILTEIAPGRGWLHGHTSGTTGSPLSLWYDRETCVMTNAADRLQKAWGGMADEDWIGMFLGRTITPLHVRTPPFWHANRVQRQVWFSSFHLSESTLPLYLAEIARRRLRFVEGYPSTLFILAKHILASGASVPMRGVFASSETMLDIQRETIERAFQAPVFDFYGHAERAVFAIECDRHAGKHVVEPFGYVEIVDSNGKRVPDGETGYITGTSLHNTAMPLLRYRTTDLSAFEIGNCDCGRPFRRIRDIATKAEDIVVLPDGRWISPSILTHPFKPYPQIKKSQVIQEGPDQLRLKIVAGHDFTQSHETALRAAVQGRVGDEMRITVERVEDIPAERSGKYRWVISKVSHGLRVDWRA